MLNTQSNILTIDKYLIFLNERIGKGMFGEVFRGSYLSGRENGDQFLAVKMLEISGFSQEKITEELENIKQEIKILRCLKHPNIVRLHDVKRVDKRIYIFTEFCNQGDLKSFIMKNDLSEDEIFYYFAQVINGFKYLRKKDIVHRDIKPENILLNNHIVKIADFGFAKKVNGDIGMMSFKGTPMTMAPQILEEVPCTNKTDIYSLGATLYFMIFKSYPYNANNLIHLVNKFKAGELPTFNQNGITVSEEVKSLLLRMLAYEEKDRIDWEDLFKHPKFQLYENKGKLEGLNIIGMIGDDSLNLVEDEYPELEFDFSPQGKPDLDNKKIAEVGRKIMDEWNLKQKMDEITFKFNSRITFERGIAWFVKKVAQRYDEFCKKKNLMNLQELPFELLNMLKFAISKFELVMLKSLKEKLESYENLCQIDEEYWDMFGKTEEYQTILKCLKYDFITFSNLVSQNYGELIEPLRNINMKPYNSEMIKIFQSSTFDPDLNNFEEEEFNNSFTNLVLALLMHFKKTKIDKIKINVYGSYENQEDKELIFLIDDFLILLAYKNIFKWEEQKPINFNKFLQDRMSYCHDINKGEEFNIIKERVLLTYEHIL